MLKQLQHPTRPRPVYIGGWKRQTKDDRDAAYAIKAHRGLLSLPTAAQTSCDNRSICSAVEDQTAIGSCTANALAGLIESNEIRTLKKFASSSSPTTRDKAAAGPTVSVTNVVTNPNGTISFAVSVVPAAPVPTPAPPAPAKVLVEVSRLFQYYATRTIGGTVSVDSGATIRDTIKAAVKYGVVDERLWPYDITKFKTNPPKAVWDAAATHKVTSYHPITDGDIETMKATLLQGYLIEFGFDVYSYFLSAEMSSKGLLCLPKPGETLQGGHAVCLVGFDDNKVMPDGSKGAFLVRNSWGTDWGVGGYYWHSYTYVGNPKLCSDFWVINSSPI